MMICSRHFEKDDIRKRKQKTNNLKRICITNEEKKKEHSIDDGLFELMPLFLVQRNENYVVPT